MIRRRALLLVLGALCVARGIDAQSAVRQAGAFELWAGLSNESPQWGILGETPGMRFGMLALRWTRALGAPVEANVLPATEWTVDLIPLARMSPPLTSLTGSGLSCPRASLCVAPQDPADQQGYFPPGSPLAVGIAPLGVTRRFFRMSRASPFVGVNGGMLVFTERVPTSRASRANFTASAEIGVRFGPPAEPAITLSYRFHHISNAGVVTENPGLASHLIAVGLHRPRLRRDTSPARP